MIQEKNCVCVCVCSVLAFYWSVIHMQKSEHITSRQFDVFKNWIDV